MLRFYYTALSVLPLDHLTSFRARVIYPLHFRYEKCSGWEQMPPRLAYLRVWMMKRPCSDDELTGRNMWSCRYWASAETPSTKMKQCTSVRNLSVFQSSQPFVWRKNGGRARCQVWWHMDGTFWNDSKTYATHSIYRDYRNARQ